VASRAGLESVDVLDVLSSLFDKNLVAIEDTPRGQRYRLLETVREYLRETHGDTAELAETCARHRAYFVELTRSIEPRLVGGEAAALMDLLEIEHDNVRAAFESGLAEDPLDSLRIVNAVARFWAIRGYWIEGIDRVNRALDASKSLPESPDHAGALVCAGRLLMLSGSYDAAERAAVKGLAIYESHSDLAAVARSHLLLGTIATNQGDFERSKRELEASRELYERLGLHGELPFVANNLGVAYAHAGQFEMAERSFEEAIRLVRANGGKATPSALNNIGIVRFGLCDYEKAARSCKEALQVAGELGDRQALANCHHMLGCIACSRGDLVEARRLLEKSLFMADSLGFLTLACDSRFYLSITVFEMGFEVEARLLLAEALKGFVKARKLLEQVRSLMAGGMFYGDPRLFVVADRVRSEAGVVLTKDDQRRFESFRSRLREAMGDEAFDAALREGEAMSADEAVAAILQ
jgi:tetratricopeptide (TPR) repeat protein